MVSGLATVATSARAWRPRRMTDLPEHGSLGVRELQSPIQLALQDAVFRGQIFVPRQQLLIHRPGNVGKDARPVHNGPLVPTVVPLNGGAIDRPKNVPDGLQNRYPARE
jgi:hypothetical protein